VDRSLFFFFFFFFFFSFSFFFFFFFFFLRVRCQHPVDLLSANAHLMGGPDPDTPSEGRQRPSPSGQGKFAGCLNHRRGRSFDHCGSRRRGRIAVIASIASLFVGFPTARGIAAEKTVARLASSEALRAAAWSNASRGMDRRGVRILRFAEDRRFDGPTQFLLRLRRRRIDRKRGIRQWGRRRVAFPLMIVAVPIL